MSNVKDLCRLCLPVPFKSKIYGLGNSFKCCAFPVKKQNEEALYQIMEIFRFFFIISFGILSPCYATVYFPKCYTYLY